MSIIEKILFYLLFVAHFYFFLLFINMFFAVNKKENEEVKEDEEPQ